MSTLLALALSLVVAMPESARFPTVTSKNLEGRPMTLPADFAGQRNVVFVAFKREQQDLIDAWLPFVKVVVARTPNTDFSGFRSAWCGRSRDCCLRCTRA